MSQAVTTTRPVFRTGVIGTSDQREKQSTISGPTKNISPSDRDYVIIADQPEDAGSRCVTGAEKHSFCYVSSHHPSLARLRREEDGVPSMHSNTCLTSISQAQVVVVPCMRMLQLPLLVNLRAFLSASTPIVALCNPNSARGVSILAGGADFVYQPPVSVQTIEATKIAHTRSIGKAVQENVRATHGSLMKSDLNSTDLEVSPNVGPLVFDIETHTVKVRGDHESMSRRPFLLLHYLASHRGDCCTRTRILEEVWDLEFDPGTNIVDVQIYKVRKMLETYNLRNMVQTVRGRGYRLDWPLEG